jgi:hypothetical protein
MIDYKISPGTAGNSDIPERYDDLPSHNIEVFQSENIQNILDAKSKNKAFVEIHYEIKKLESEDRQKLKKLLGNDFFRMLLKSFELCQSDDIEEQVEKVELALKHEDKWHSLIITEKNTTGLIGDEGGREKGSKYHALMRHINKSEKDDISGGTFGKGSSVYTYCSGLWLWFAYTILETKSNNTRARFIGRGMLAPFIDNEDCQSYTGPLWYARREKKEELIKGNKQQGLPYVDYEAHEQAEKFGLKRRLDNEPGTTYLIPVFWPDGISENEMNSEKISNELKREIIKRWFVPIYNESLRCFIKIYGEEDSVIQITKNDLESIPELKYKLEILNWYNGGADPNDKRFKRQQIKIDLPLLIKSQQKKAEEKFGKKIGNKKISAQVDLVIRHLSDEEKKFTGFLDEENRGTINRIALIRNKGMIVNHFPYNSRQKDDLKNIVGENNFEGILFAGKMSKLKQPDDATNLLEIFLSYAENPAHNEWVSNDRDLNRCHLKRFEERPFPAPVSRLKSIFDKIYSIIQDFYPKDDKPPAKNEICSFWRRLYKLPAAGSSKGGESGFTYETIAEGFDDEGRYFWKLNLSSTNSEKLIRLQFGHYLNSLEGSIKKQDEFKELGIPEFNELLVYENGNLVSEVILEYDKEAEQGIPKMVEIKFLK